MKKENLIPLLLVVLGFAFVVISLIVFITKGKSYYFIKKKLKIGALIITLTAVLNGNSLSADYDHKKTCYMPIRRDEIEEKKELELETITIMSSIKNNIITYSLSKKEPVKGFVSNAGKNNKISFKITNSKDKTILSDNLTLTNDSFEIILNEMKKGTYKFYLYLSEKETQTKENLFKQYKLKIIK